MCACERAREGVGGEGRGGGRVFCMSLRICVCIHFHAVNTCVFFCVICGSAEVATLQWAGSGRAGLLAEAPAARPVCSKATEAPDSPLVTVYLSTNTGRSV